MIYACIGMLSRVEKHRSLLDAMYLYFFRMRFLPSVLGDF